MKKSTLYCGLALLSCVTLLPSCSEEEIKDDPTPEEESLPEWFYAGGKLGTTLLSTSNAFEQLGSRC